MNAPPSPHPHRTTIPKTRSRSRYWRSAPVLTEQTLGRGLRLPFAAHTGIEILDTLEVVLH
jgi:hypothetical protein